MTTIRELLDEEELGLLLEALNRFEKHCKSIADRPFQGYGSATEQLKKQAWRHKADRLKELEEKIAYEFI